MSKQSVVRFGLFEADLQSRELRRNGHKVRLQDQPFQVLLLLLEKPGEVITREELRTRLWPSDTFVDFDHGLNAAIKRLRDALGDSAENPRFVETLAGKGFELATLCAGKWSCSASLRWGDRRVACRAAISGRGDSCRSPVDRQFTK